MTTNGGTPHNVNIWIPQQPLIGSEISNLSPGDQTKMRKACYEDDLWWEAMSNGKWPPMEDSLQWNKTSKFMLKEDLQWKMTLKYPKWNISATADWIFIKFYTKAQGTKPNKMKTTSNGRWPQNIKSWISQQQLIGSF
jgi:hypothetical protein